MAAPYRVRVYDTAIASLHQPGGDVFDEASDITRRVEQLAVLASARFRGPQQRPRNEARIVNSHRRQVQPSGRFGSRGQVVNDSPHAIYKHEGTPPIITAKHIGADGEPGYMMIPPGPWGPRRARVVSGQIGEPWLLDAANVVLSRYGVRARPY